MADGFDSFVNGLNSFGDAIGNINNSISGGTKEQGFASPNAPSADINLPFAKVSPGVTAVQPSKRHLISWFIPDMGVVKMYVNPENISYQHRKLIRPNRTKGGYSIQYWGEELTTITMRGTTGSSGIEGINALYEVYRSEQYTFDAVGLTLSSNNAAENTASNLFNAGANYLQEKITKGVGGIGGALLGGVVGAMAPSQNILSTRNLPTLAANALTVEMYYMGWVFRGYFTNFTITESTELLFTYDIGFTATQRRGYRTNFLPWHKSPIGGGGDFGNHYEQDFNPSNLGAAYDSETGTATSNNYSFKNTFNTR